MNEVIEVCSHCEAENDLLWNIEADGYMIHCPHCGEEMMLCDECLHADDNPTQYCDWTQACHCFRYRAMNK